MMNEARQGVIVDVSNYTPNYKQIVRSVKDCYTF